MTELKCPFCQHELSYMDTIDGGFEIFSCDCKRGIWLFGNDKFWQALIDTKKKLDIALKELKASDKYYQDDECIKEAIKKIEQINNKD